MNEAERALDKAVKQYDGGYFARFGRLGEAQSTGTIVSIGVTQMGNMEGNSLRVEYSSERIDAFSFGSYSQFPVCVPIGEGRSIIALEDDGYIMLVTKEQMAAEAEARRSDSWVAHWDRVPYDDRNFACGEPEES